MTAEEKIRVLDSIIAAAYKAIPPPDMGNPYYGLFVAIMGVLDVEEENKNDDRKQNVP